MRKTIAGLLLAGLISSGCGSTPATADANATLMPGGTSRAAAATGAARADASTTAAAPRQRDTSPPYIAPEKRDLMALLPPAPKNGDARDAADRRIFKETRKLKGTPRWQMAAHDAELGTNAMLDHFACALGVKATPEQLPKTVALMQKSMREAASTVGPAKDFYKRKRPFKVDKGEICVPERTVGDSYDYPSGHTTAGWAWALVLAQVDPDNALPLLARGRAIGDSRVVCGMHNASAVENARMFTGAAITLVSASPLFQTDLAAARTELAAFRAGPHEKPDAAACALEAELVKAFW